jgi:hypothetical protein
MNIRRKLAEWFYSPGAFGLWCALDDVEHWQLREGEAFYRSKFDHNGYNEPKYVVCMCTTKASEFDGARRTPKFTGWFERRFLWRKFKRMNNRRVLFMITRLEQ